MATYLLIHDSWHGGWCWQRLSARLLAVGHRVYAPTLTGLGERFHLASPRTGLDMHVRDILQLIEFEDLRDVTLVGHGYGGMVAAGAARQCPYRISRLVFLDAFLPQDGQRAFDLQPGLEEAWTRLAAEEGKGWLVPPQDALDLGISRPEDLAWVQCRLTPMPILTYQQPVRAFEPAAGGLDAWDGDRSWVIPASYIACAGGAHAASLQTARQAGWPVAELAAGHDVILTQPEQTAEVLGETAHA